MKFISEGLRFQHFDLRSPWFIYSPAVPSREENVFGSSKLYGLHTSLTSQRLSSPGRNDSSQQETRVNSMQPQLTCVSSMMGTIAGPGGRKMHK